MPWEICAMTILDILLLGTAVSCLVRRIAAALMDRSSLGFWDSQQAEETGIYHSESSTITRGSDTSNGISSTRKQGSRGILLGDGQKRHMCCVASADSEC